MRDLDTPDELLAVDTTGMFAAAEGLPEQCEAAVQSARKVAEFPHRAAIENVVVLGMGGSGIAGDMLIAIAEERMRLPVIVVKEYQTPSFINSGSLVFAISYSGNTEETLEAASESLNRGARVVAITTGGKLAALADEAGCPVVEVPKGLQPRAAIGALSLPAPVILEFKGLFPGFHEEWCGAHDQLCARREMLLPAVPTDANPAKRLARALARQIPLIYGGGRLGAVAAYRFKCQVNENAKAPAFWSAYPELDHNEIVGWGQHGDATRQLIALVELRHDFEHPQVRRRFELTHGLIEECVARFEEVAAHGNGALAQLFDLIYMCDYASLYMAAGEGVDPGPVEVITRLKEALGG